MAFFGLTALGRQNVFAASARTSRNMQIFVDEDFISAWSKVNGDQLHCTTNKIEELLTTLFRGPVPENDLIHINRAFDEYSCFQETNNTISYSHFMKIMIQLRDTAAAEEVSYFGKSKPSCEFNSSSEYNSSIMRNRAFEKSLHDKQIKPISSTQVYQACQKFMRHQASAMLS